MNEYHVMGMTSELRNSKRASKCIFCSILLGIGSQIFNTVLFEDICLNGLNSFFEHALIFYCGSIQCLMRITAFIT